MITNKGLLRSDIFYVDHLKSEDERDERDIKSFSVTAPEGQGLLEYLKTYASQEERDKSMRTYLVRDIETDECVGYFSLKAGLISLNEVEIEVEDTFTGEMRIEREFDTMPGVELANFAVNSNYIDLYPYQKGVGYVIFKKFILPIINAASNYVGIKLVYIFALPYDRLIARYERYGFHRLSDEDESDLHKRLKPRYDESCKFMYLLLN